MLKNPQLAQWFMTEAAQLIVTLVVLVGGGFLLATGRATGDLVGTIQTLIVGVVSFWLGAKVSQKQTLPTELPTLPPAPSVVQDATHQA